MQSLWEETKILIWGKTYPELSTKYFETVCTGGTLEDGRYVRLYPIPFRYLTDKTKFTKYQWISAKIKKSSEDPRPESYKVLPDSIQTLDFISTDKYEWFNRSKVIFKNNTHVFETVEDLFNANKKYKVSMGFVRPLKIINVEIEDRPDADYDSFLEKIAKNKERLKQTEMFDLPTIAELKSLQFLSKRFKIHWLCKNPGCKGHKMSILDWEAYELARNIGVEKARERLNVILNLDEYSIGFFLGNFRLYPTTFAIGGIWYPKKSQNRPNLTLFD